jgi:hypothetical protein
VQFLNKRSILKKNVLRNYGQHGCMGLGKIDVQEFTKLCYVA